MEESFMQAVIQFKIVMKDNKPDVQILKKFITETGKPKPKKKTVTALTTEDVKEVML